MTIAGSWWHLIVLGFCFGLGFAFGHMLAHGIASLFQRGASR